MNNPSALNASSLEIIEPGHPALRTNQALKLRAVSQDQARFTNVLNRRPQIHLPDLEEGTWLSFEPVGDTTPAPVVANAQRVVLRSRLGDLTLQNGLNFVQALTGIGLAAETETARAQWLRQSALALLPQPLSLLFTQLLSGTALPELGQPAEPHFTAVVLLRTNDHVLATHAHAPWSAWRQLLKPNSPSQLSAAQMATWWDVHTQAHVLAGTHSLSAQALAKLTCGDMVLLDNPLFNIDGVGIIAFGPWQLEVISDGGNEMEVTDLGMQYDDAQSSFDSDTDSDTDEGFEYEQDNALIEQAAEGSEVANLGLVPVQLRFEMGTVSLSLKALNELSLGTIIRLQGDVNPPCVVIRAGAQTVGRGELVDLEGRLGVQITQWVGP
jgi:type III secretion protein Q